MAIFIDQLNRKVELATSPKRIISLVPSQTELLFDLGLKEEVVGITKFCVHPEDWFKTKPRVGGTKKIDFEKIKSLQPDLIIGNKEENEQEQIEELMKYYNVWMSDIYTLKDAYDMITRVGTIVGRQQEATFLKLQIESKFTQFFQQQTTNNQQRSAAYLIWYNPIMAAGSRTFINELLKVCGFTNVFETGRYPEITVQQLKEANPDVILLSSEPYPFNEKHVQEFQSICPQAKVLQVDGELFSWYGSRLLQAPNYFREVLSL
jgi:ABC-type Fe3+-hydroxamate transport system substrate-binding protein